MVEWGDWERLSDTWDGQCLSGTLPELRCSRETYSRLSHRGPADWDVSAIGSSRAGSSASAGPDSLAPAGPDICCSCQRLKIQSLHQPAAHRELGAPGQPCRRPPASEATAAAGASQS